MPKDIVSANAEEAVETASHNAQTAYDFFYSDSMDHVEDDDEARQLRDEVLGVGGEGMDMAEQDILAELERLEQLHGVDEYDLAAAGVDTENYEQLHSRIQEAREAGTAVGYVSRDSTF